MDSLASRYEANPDGTVGPACEGCDHVKRLAARILQSEPLEHPQRQHLHLQLRKPPANAHARPVTEGDVRERVGGVVGGAAAQPPLGEELARPRVVALRQLVDDAGDADAGAGGDLVAGQHQRHLGQAVHASHSRQQPTGVKIYGMMMQKL